MAYENEMDNSTPWVPNKPPPTGTPEDYHREEIKSAKTGVAILLIIGFGMARTIQVFSRWPGTSGVVMMLLWPAGLVVEGTYLLQHLEEYGRIDATDCRDLIAAQFAVYAVGLVVRLFRHRDAPTINQHDPGRGVLCWMLPFASHDVGGAISDLVVGATLIGIFHALGSPIQAGTYQVILGLTVFCHVCVLGQRLSHRLRADAARRRARNWRGDVKGRHYV